MRGRVDMESEKPQPLDLTRLLLEWKQGDDQALETLFPLVYGELRRIAAGFLRRERSDHTLQSTALVHEAYLKLLGHGHGWEGRAHFFGLAAQAMRRILVDHARSRRAGKRGGPAMRVELQDHLAVVDTSENYDLIALDEALDALSKLDERQCRVVEMRYFAGLTIEETAEALGLSAPTVKRDWVTARLFLARHLKQKAAASI